MDRMTDGPTNWNQYSSLNFIGMGYNDFEKFFFLVIAYSWQTSRQTDGHTAIWHNMHHLKESDKTTSIYNVSTRVLSKK